MLSPVARRPSKRGHYRNAISCSPALRPCALCGVCSASLTTGGTGVRHFRLILGRSNVEQLRDDIALDDIDCICMTTTVAVAPRQSGFVDRLWRLWEQRGSISPSNVVTPTQLRAQALCSVVKWPGRYCLGSLLGRGACSAQFQLLHAPVRRS